MMSDGNPISAFEWELLAFFERAPNALDPDVSWPYNSFEYRTRSGEFDVTFSIAPAYKDFTLSVKFHGQPHVEIAFPRVQDVQYRSAPNERLVIFVDDTHVLELRLRPAFSLLGGDWPTI